MAEGGGVRREGLDVNELLSRYEGLVREAAYRLGRENDDDALQCGRVGLWEAAMVWDGVRPFEPLARRCIRNNIIDYVRRPAPQEDELPDDLPSEPLEEAESREELLARVRAAFPRRSRERKILVALIRGGDKRSIAVKLGVSERTVVRTARKAVERLKRERGKE